MKTANAIAPPQAVRRPRPLRLEPLVFAALLALLTLAINKGAEKPAPEHRTSPAPTSQVAVAR